MEENLGFSMDIISKLFEFRTKIILMSQSSDKKGLPSTFKDEEIQAQRTQDHEPILKRIKKNGGLRKKIPELNETYYIQTRSNKTRWFSIKLGGNYIFVTL